MQFTSNEQGDSSTLTVKYSGEAIVDGLMDVAELAPALAALQQALVASTEQLNHGATEPRVFISAETRKGSFEFVLILLQLLKDAALFVEVANSSLKVTEAVFGERGLLHLLQSLGGAKDKDIEQKQLSTGDVEFKVVGIGNKVETHVHNTIIVDPAVAELYRRRDIRGELYPVVKPLTRSGIESVSFKTLESSSEVDADDVKSFVPPDISMDGEEDDEGLHKSEEVLYIVKPLQMIEDGAFELVSACSER